MQRRIGDQIEKDAVQGRGELFESFSVADLRNIGELARCRDVDRLLIIEASPERKIEVIGEAEPTLDLRIGDEKVR